MTCPIYDWTAVCRTQNYLDVYARGNNYQLQHIPMSNNGVWGAWENMGGSVGKVAVCFLNANTINTYTRGASDELWLKQWTGTGGWAGFTYQGNCFY